MKKLKSVAANVTLLNQLLACEEDEDFAHLGFTFYKSLCELDTFSAIDFERIWVLFKESQLPATYRPRTVEVGACRLSTRGNQLLVRASHLKR